MKLKHIDIKGFKSFARREQLVFGRRITAVVGPNGSGKSNIAEAFRFVLGEQSMKSLRSKKTEDLLFNGSAALPRTNRASVSLTFDNSDGAVEKAFSEIEIERVIHRDASNEYYINNSPARLKDIVDILARAKIGSAGHNIISQGEADRMLSMNPRDRKTYIEEALGLTQYQLKKNDALKKLIKTEENLVSVRSLAREHAPHLHYLEREMKQIEEKKALVRELKKKAQEYARVFLPYNHSFTNQKEVELNKVSKKATEITEYIQAHSNEVNTERYEEERRLLRSTLQEVSRRLEDIRVKKGNLERAIGRLEAKLEFEIRAETTSKNQPQRNAAEQLTKIRTILKKAVQAPDLASTRELINEALTASESTPREASKLADSDNQENERISEIKLELQTLTEEIKSIKESEVDSVSQKEDIEQQISLSHQKEEREKSNITNKEHELKTLTIKKDSLGREVQALQEQEKRFFALLEEIVFVTGVRFKKEDLESNEDHDVVMPSELRTREQELERLKVKVESLHVGNEQDIEREYTTAKERAEFLKREISDLEATTEKLRLVADELNEKIEREFAEGLKKISSHFSNFFSHMFKGGNAELVKVSLIKRGAEEEQAREEIGVEVRVQMPHKKLKSIAMLSGGEKTLVSIALVFALSQVNPPPFLILDETDAALDEANSRRYAEALRELSKHSQLILITHNRETMSHAGQLLGITMGKAAASEVLAIDLEEAEKIVR